MKCSILLFNRFMCFIILFVGIIIPALSNERPSEPTNEYSVEMLIEEKGFVSSNIYAII
ncbi:MAG: hypothetical protein ACI9U5_001214 [Colwellia sp.]|jgi:hypothetical protein